MVLNGPDDDQLLVFGGLTQRRYSGVYSSEDYCADMHVMKIVL